MGGFGTLANNVNVVKVEVHMIIIVIRNMYTSLTLESISFYYFIYQFIALKCFSRIVIQQTFDIVSSLKNLSNSNL